MDFRDYTYVQAIAQYKNISKAAEALYITQPSLSKFLQKLEDQIGTPLFNRINKQMYPTYAGEQFIQTGQEIFRLQGKLDRTLERICHETSGRLSLTTTATRGYYVLTEVLPVFKALYPGYHIEIMERNVDEIEESLRDGVTDLAIYAITNRNPEFRYYHINTEEVVLCLSSDAPYTDQAVHKDGFRYPWLDVSCLENEVCFSNDPIQWMIGRIGRSILREAKIKPELTVFRSLDTCLALASRGLGFTFAFDISVSCFKNYIKPPVYLSTGSRAYLAEFVIATRKNYELSGAEKDFLRLVKERFGAGIPKNNSLFPSNSDIMV